MADIDININTKATGDGAKKVSDDIDKLREGSKQAAKTSQSLNDKIEELDNVSDDAKDELRKLVRELNDLSKRADRSADISQKLANGMELTEDEAKQLTRTLDRLDNQHKQLNRTTEKSPEISKKAAKEKSRMGLAALEASRAVEDMQYGVRGMINNIPQLILHLGGSAGLTAVISLLVVGLAQLVPLLIQEADQTKLNAEIAEEAAKKKIAASVAQRAENRRLRQELELYRADLKQEIDSTLRAALQTDQLTAARRRAFEAQQAINNEQLALDIAIVSADNGLSDIEKLAKIAELKRQNELERQRAEAERLEQEIEAKRDSIEKSYEELEATLFKNQEQKPILEGQIEQAKVNLAELKKSADELEATIQKISIPNLDKVLNAESALSGDFFAPDRKDFETDQAFLEAVQDLLAAYPDREDSVGAFESVTQQLEILEKVREQILSVGGGQSEGGENVIGELDKLKNKLSALNEETERAVQERNKLYKEGEKEIEQLEEKLATEQKLNEIRNKRAEIETAAAAKQTSSNTITKEAGELRADLESDLENVGAAQKEIAEARKAADGIQRTIVQAFRDGVLDVQEYQQVTKELGEFRRLFTAQNEATLKNIIELKAALEANIKATNSLQQQVRSMPQQIISP